MVMSQTTSRELLVTDDHVCLSALAGRAPERGWQLRPCRGPFRALVQLLRGTYPAVLLDEKDLRGREADLVAEFRRASADTVIAVTVAHGPEPRGVDCVLRLPCDPALLLEEVGRAVAEREAERRRRQLETEAERLKSELAGQSRQLERLRQAWARLSEVVDEPMALREAIAQVFTQVAEVERFSLMLRDPTQPDELCVVKTVGWEAPPAGAARRKVGEGVAGLVAQRGEPLLVRQRGERPGVAGPVASYRSESFLSLPLRARGRMLGVVNLTERRGGPFTEADLHLLAFLADRAALALALAQEVEETRRQAMHDPLTGLFNRAYFLDALAREVERARRDGRTFAVAMIDLDGLKPLNDRQGHQAGDALLRQFAQLLRRNVRAIDILCRYGGDEFAIIFPDTGQEPEGGQRDHSYSVERLRLIVAHHHFSGDGILPGTWITFSAGVASYPADGEAPALLVAVADQRLYEAKKRGRNQVVPPSARGGR